MNIINKLNFSLKEITALNFNFKGDIFEFSSDNIFSKNYIIKEIIHQNKVFFEIGRTSDEVVYMDTDKKIYCFCVNARNNLVEVNKNINNYIYFLQEFDKIISKSYQINFNILEEFLPFFEKYTEFKKNMVLCDKQGYDCLYWKENIMFDLIPLVDEQMCFFFDTDNTPPFCIVEYFVPDISLTKNENDMKILYEKYFLTGLKEPIDDIGKRMKEDIFGKKVYTEEEKKRIREIWGSLTPPFPLD